jgi:hypothetical protein
VFDGTVIGQYMSRHRHQEFIRFLNRIKREVPSGKDIHVILDDYAVQKIRTRSEPGWLTIRVGPFTSHPHNRPG